jgi:hypothetical protein
MSKATENKPAHATDGKVEMPAPTAWPVVLAAGITLAMLGVATSLVFSIAGGVLFLVAIIGWISQLLPGRGHEFEELAAA